MRILFTGGGSGGHFFPLLAVIQEVKRLSEEERILELELFYMGPRGIGDTILVEESVTPIWITTGKMRRYFSVRNFSDTIKVFIGILQALWKVFVLYPDVVFSKGGYGALPAVIAAIILRIPLVIHESDSVPGRVNAFSARFARRIGIAFTESAHLFPAEKTALVGVPIQKRILGGNKEDAKEQLGIFTDLPVIGVIGGSQGAEHVNEAILTALKDIVEKYEVVHQTGQKNLENVTGEARVILEFGHKEHYRAFGFMDSGLLRAFYAASDIIISRAGASSIFEIAAWGKPAILIPLANAAADHQRKNAYEYAARGAAVIIEESNLTPHILLAEIERIFNDPDQKKKMSEAAQQFAKIDAAEVIAREIIKLGIH